MEKIVWCSRRPTLETRNDKFGQKFRLCCKCGVKTNWHTSKGCAQDALIQIKHNGKIRF